jgi:hypothetical protein
LKEYFLKIVFFQGKLCFVCSREAYAAKLKKHMYLSEEKYVLEGGVSSILFPFEH